MNSKKQETSKLIDIKNPITNVKSMKNTLLERYKRIFNFMKEKKGPVFKTDFKKIGINADSAERHLDIIEFIQNQPEVQITKVRRNVIAELKKSKSSKIITKFQKECKHPAEELVQAEDDPDFVFCNLCQLEMFAP